MFVACGIWCLADVSSVSIALSRSSLVTLETSATHHIPQATNIPYQPLLIKPIYCKRRLHSVAPSIKSVFPKQFNTRGRVLHRSRRNSVNVLPVAKKVSKATTY